MSLEEAKNKEKESAKNDCKKGKMRLAIEDGRKAVLECSQAIVLMWK